MIDRHELAAAGEVKGKVAVPAQPAVGRLGDESRKGGGYDCVDRVSPGHEHSGTCVGGRLVARRYDPAA